MILGIFIILDFLNCRYHRPTRLRRLSCPRIHSLGRPSRETDDIPAFDAP